MLVKIKAIALNDSSPEEQVCYINPESIQNASFLKETNCLKLRMENGTDYMIQSPYWIKAAGIISPIMKMLYDEFVQSEQGMTSEEYDQWIDQEAKKHDHSGVDYPEYW